MLCSVCGEKVTDSYKFCPNCGNKLDAATLLPDPSPQASEPSIPLVKKKPMPMWFKLLAFLAVVALIGVTAGILFTESLVDVIDHQLEALRKQDIEKAYHAYTSKNFQSTISLDQFRNFVEAYPVFFSNQSAHFSQRSIDHHIGIFKGNLTDQDHSNTPIEYKLIKEDGKWKILSMRLLKPGNIKNAKEADHAEDLIEVTKGQLRDIQESRFEEAYQDYSSQEFQKATTFEAFEAFIKRHPILNNYHAVSFHKPTIRHGVGTLSVIVQSDKFAAYIKYYLIREDQTWKVWSMRILSPDEENEKEVEIFNQHFPFVPFLAKEKMDFGSILLGSKVDQHGQIVEPTNFFNAELKDLFVDIEIKNGHKGSMIYLTLQHLESGSSIPAKALIEENGETMLMSVFSPPTSGWPKGHYKLTVHTEPDIQKTVEYQIEY